MADGQSWSMAGNWDNGVPNNGNGMSFTANIANGDFAFLDISPVVIDGLSIGSASSLGLSPGSSLQLGDPNFQTLGALNNAGYIDVNSGTLTIDSRSGTRGSFNNNSSNTGTLNLDYGKLVINDSNGGVGTALNGGGVIQLNNGIIQGGSGDELFAVAGTIQGTGTISNLTLEPLTGALITQPSLTLDESQGGQLAIASGTTLQTNGGGVLLLGTNESVSVDNKGTINVGTGDTFTFRGDGTPGGAYFLVNESAINVTNGTLVLDGTGSGYSAFEIGGGANPGTLTLAGGTISGFTGTEFFGNYLGSTIQGNGTIGTSTFANVGNVVADGGRLTLSNSLDYNPGSQTLSTTDGLGTYAVNNNASLQFGNMPAGTGIVTNAANIVLNGNGQFVDASGNNALSNFLSTNSGSLTLQNGANLVLGTQSFSNTGTLNVLANSTLDTRAGGFTSVDGGGALTEGTYVIGGTLRYSGADIATIGPNANLTLDNAGAIMNGSGAGHNALTDSLTTNSGTLTLQKGADLILGTQTFTNAGNLNILANSTLDLTNGAFGNVDVNGVLKGGAYTIGGTLLYNGPAIAAISHTASLTLDGSGSILNGLSQDQLANSLARNYGTLTLQDGADLILGTQTFTNHGNLNIAANAALDLTGGAFGNVDGNGVLKGGSYTIGGALAYAGNDIVTIGTHTSLTLDGQGNIYNVATYNTVSSTLSTNNGTLILQNGATVESIGNTFTNTGSAAVLTGSYLLADSFINSGSLTVDGSGVLNNILYPSEVESGNGFMNSGMVSIENGGLIQVDSGNYTQTDGISDVNGTLVADVVDLQGGSLTGAGMIEGTLLNEGGTVAPGEGAPGILTASGFIQTSGTLLFDIQSGIDYSQLQIANNAQFAGNIGFDFLNGFTPTDDQVYTLIAYGSATGEFGSFTISNLPGDYLATMHYEANELDVTFSAAPEPGSIVLMLAGLGAIGFARRRWLR
jgi:hypothetical protein